MKAKRQQEILRIIDSARGKRLRNRTQNARVLEPLAGHFVVGTQGKARFHCRPPS